MLSLHENTVSVFDIETLDTNPSGVVLSLGVVFFDLGKVQPFEELVAQGTNIYFNQEEQIAVGRTKSQDTLDWWAQQGEEAALCLDNPNKTTCTDLYVALNDLYRQIGFQPDRKNTRWFSRGYFDIAFMDSFCRSFELEPMIKYWAWRDSRSWLDGRGIGTQNQKLKKPEGFVEHNSHHDSAFEAYMMQRLYNGVELEFEPKVEPLIKHTFTPVTIHGTTA